MILLVPQRDNLIRGIGIHTEERGTHLPCYVNCSPVGQSEDSGEEQSAVVADFLKWVLTDGQKTAVKLGYPPLPSNLVEIELQRLGIGGK
jgi:hypothetical protein